MSLINHIEWRNVSLPIMVLGTAQLGSDYGIANRSGKPSDETARDLIDTALDCGVRCFDTAQCYGDSEIRLGAGVRETHAKALVVTKFSPTLDPRDGDALDKAMTRSEKRLGSIWCMMLHCADWLNAWDDGLGRVLLQARERGVFAHVGVSVYTLADARRAISHPEVDVVQVPCNAWDRRMVEAGIFELADENGTLLMVRSVFLQGLLLLDPAEAGARVPGADMAARRWQAFCAEYGRTPLEMAVQFVLSLEVPLVIGAETPAQVRRNAELVALPPLEEDLLALVDKTMGDLPETIWNPALWSNT